MQAEQETQALLAQWQALKETEQEALKKRRDIEAALLELVPSKEVGSQTTKLGDIKLTITRGITYRLNKDNWERVEPEIPEHLRPIKIKVTKEVDPKGLKWLAENEPELYAKACSVIVEQPKLPYFAVKPIEE